MQPISREIYFLEGVWLNRLSFLFIIFNFILTPITEIEIFEKTILPRKKLVPGLKVG